MMHREFQNIKKLKKNERKKMKTLFQTAVNNLLLNMNSEQLITFQNFNIWLNDIFSETVAEVSNSSWDFSLIFKYSQYVHNLFTWSDTWTDLEHSVDLKFLLLRIL